MKENYLKLEFLSLPENQAFARDAVAAFCLPLNPTLSQLSDVKTAVSEAVKICTVHAYRGTSGIVTVVGRTDGCELHIKISDRGAGIADVNAAVQPLFYNTTFRGTFGHGFYHNADVHGRVFGTV